MSTLQEAIDAVRVFRLKPRPRTARLADKLLGKGKGSIPTGISSTQFLKELRRSLYGKCTT